MVVVLLLVLWWWWCGGGGGGCLLRSSFGRGSVPGSGPTTTSTWRRTWLLGWGTAVVWLVPLVVLVVGCRGGGLVVVVLLLVLWWWWLPSSLVLRSRLGARLRSYNDFYVAADMAPWFGDGGGLALFPQRTFEDKIQRQQQRQEKANIRLKQKQERFRKIRKGELLPSDAKDSSDSENTSSTDSESESAGWAWKNKSVDVMNVKPYEGGRLEFHLPQDRIRIFIPGFDSNPCVWILKVEWMIKFMTLQYILQASNNILWNMLVWKKKSSLEFDSKLEDEPGQRNHFIHPPRQKFAWNIWNPHTCGAKIIWAMKKNPGWLDYIRGWNPTQLYRDYDYKQPIRRIPMNQPGFHGK